MASLKPYTLIMSISLSLLMSACMIAQPLTAEERQIETDLDVRNYYPATREMRANIETQPLFTQAAFWGREYDLNPSDLESAIKLSASVRKLGNPQRAIEIAQTTRALYPRDPYLTAEYAAALIASERALDAIGPLDDALRVAPNYARLWSLKGAALDQTEQYEDARRHYNRALQITPNDPNILANLGLSYALAGDPVTAERWLRQASALPGAGAGVHHNLGLVLQLQGKTAEAQKISRLSRGDQKLPPAPVPAHNIAPVNTQNTPPNSRRPQPYATQGQYAAPQQFRPQAQLRPASTGQTYSSASDAARNAAALRQQGPNARTAKPLPTAGELTPEQLALLNQVSGNLNPQDGQAYPSQNVQGQKFTPRGYPAQPNQTQTNVYSQGQPQGNTQRQPARRRR